MARKRTEGAGAVEQLPSGGYRVRWYAITATGERKRRGETFATQAEAEAHLGGLRRTAHTPTRAACNDLLAPIPQDLHKWPQPKPRDHATQHDPHLVERKAEDRTTLQQSYAEGNRTIRTADG